MPEVYAKKLRVEPPEGSSFPSALLELLRAWVGDRWDAEQEWFVPEEPATRATTDGSIFRWEPFESKGSFLYEFTWRHPHTDAPEITWATQASLYRADGPAKLSVRVWNTGPDLDEPGFLATTRPRLLLDLPAHLNVKYLDESGFKIESRPIAEDEFHLFARYELLNPKRSHPILVATPLENGSYPVAPNTLAGSFLTLAEVVHADSPRSTFALSDELDDRRLSCYNGAARVYLPGFSKDADPLRHPLMMPRQLDHHRARLRLAQYLARLSVRYYEPDDEIPTLRDTRALESDRRRRELKSALEEARSKGDPAEWEKLAEGYASENDKLREENAELREQLRVSQKNNKALSRAFQESRAEQAGGVATEAEPEFEPETVHEMVEHADEMFGEDLLILPTAFDSAEDSPYRHPGRLLEALKITAEIAAMKRDGPLGKNLRDVFQERGLDYRGGISETTPDNLRQQYQFSVDGEATYCCEEHLCFGTSRDPLDCARIYFATDGDEEGRFIVGHVGRHLDVITT